MQGELDRHKSDKDKCIERLDRIKDINDADEYIHELTEAIKELFMERTSFVKNSDNNKARDEFFKLLEFRIRKLYVFNMCEGKPADNIEFIGTGHTSLAFRIGDEVLKIGKTDINGSRRQTLRFDCLLPLSVDECYQVGENEYYTIMVSPFVDTNDISEENLYEVYKALRDKGYIWNDPRPDNAGRLIRDYEVNDVTHKKGDLVIIDLEDLAYVGEITPDIVLEELAISSYNSRTYGFETRYIEEKARKNGSSK